MLAGELSLMSALAEGYVLPVHALPSVETNETCQLFLMNFLSLPKKSNQLQAPRQEPHEAQPVQGPHRPGRQAARVPTVLIVTLAASTT